MEYYGDQAGILPESTQTIQHFSDQFVQMEQQRAARKAAQQKAEQQRRVDAQKYLGDRLDNKDFLTNATYQGIVNNGLTGISMKASEMIKKGTPQEEVMAFIDNSARDLGTRTRRVNELDANIVKDAAALHKVHPEMDLPALLSFARHDASYERLPDGSYKLRDMLEVDPNGQHVIGAYKQHFPDLHTNESGEMAKSKLIDGEKTVEYGDKENIYDENNNVKEWGKIGKIPTSLVNVVPDGKGKWKTELKSEDYKLPNGQVYTNPATMQPVKVVPKDVFDKYYFGSDEIAAQVERKLRKELEEPVKLNNGQEVMYSPDSPYADMRRRAILYEDLQDNVKDKFVIGTPKDESFDRKLKANREKMAEEKLALAERASARQDKKLDLMIDKATGDATLSLDVYKPILDKIDSQPAGYEPRVYDLPLASQNVILDFANSVTTSDKKDENGKPEKLTNEDLYVSKTADGKIQVIKRQVVDKKIEDTPLGTLNYEQTNDKVNKPAKQKQNMFQRAYNSVKGVITPRPKENKKETISW